VRKVAERLAKRVYVPGCLVMAEPRAKVSGMADDLCPGCGTPDPGRRRRGLGPICYEALLATGERVHFGVRDIPGRRFVRHVDMGGPLPDHDDVEGPCWPWTGAVNDRGYGVFREGPGRVMYAHVWAAEHAYAPAPPGYEWDHACHHHQHCTGGPTCRHRRCVNPAHLRLQTSRQNTLAGVGPTAANARKTRCSRRHPLTGANVYTPPSRPWERQCRTCRAEADRRRRETGSRARAAQRAAADAVARISSREAPRPPARTG
jgi:hypothetical protein